MNRFAVGLLSISLASCAEFNSIHRTTDLFPGDNSVNARSISIDAKQRFLLAGEKVTKQKGTDGKSVKTAQPIFCSEPSPDVFSVFSAALEANAGDAKELTAALKLATGETGATIGIRTQSIQLLRDAMYRICEGYLGGGLNEGQYEDLLKRYQKSMVTLIAIEQLTGAARPGQVILQSGATINASSAVFEAKKGLNTARENHEKAAAAQKKTGDAVTAAETALGDDPKSKCEGTGKPEDADKEKCKALTDAKEADTKAKNDLTVAKREMDEWQQVFNKIENATSVLADGEGRVVPAVGTQMDAATVASLAGEVRELVRDVFMEDYINSCLTDAREFAAKVVDLQEKQLEIPTTQINQLRDREKTLTRELADKGRASGQTDDEVKAELEETERQLEVATASGDAMKQISKNAALTSELCVALIQQWINSIARETKEIAAASNQ